MPLVEVDRALGQMCLEGGVGVTVHAVSFGTLRVQVLTVGLDVTPDMLQWSLQAVSDSVEDGEVRPISGNRWEDSTLVNQRRVHKPVADQWNGLDGASTFLKKHNY